VRFAEPCLPLKAFSMDELLREFLTETNESLDVVDVELVRFERDPNNAEILANIFRLVHTIKGTCGFLGLPRLATLAHAAESLMGKFRDGAPVTIEAVTLILSTIDRIKEILDALEKNEHEPEGADEDLIGRLYDMAESGEPAAGAVRDGVAGSSVYQTLERPLRPGEVPLDVLERAFREAPGPEAAPGPAPTPKRRVSDKEADDKGEGKVANQSIRVNLETLENLMTMVSELVLTRNQLLEMARREDDSEFKLPLQRLSNVTAELQESVMKTRMQPIGNAWQKLPRVVRDLSAELGKQIEIEMHGVETELDRQVLDRIKDPLTHMVRNSADHALETPQERVAVGKPEKGTIRLNAYQAGGHIIIEVADDGRGLDMEKIKAKAIANGLASEADIEKMPEAQIQKFIFAPGFSTAATVTSVSGRGVGMDVVQTNIEELGGTVDVKSVPGEGSIFTIKLPLTLAIVSALIIESGGECFAIPQLAVVELVRVKTSSGHRIERIKDTPVLRLRDKLLPLVSLNALLRIGDGAGGEAEKGFIVVTQIGHQTFGIVVDSVFHTEEIVVKPVSALLRHIAAFSGITILGDGSVIMILDPNGIAESAGSFADAPALASAAARAEDEANNANADSTSLLVFRAGTAQPKAVPLALVTRLEEIDCRKIELSNGRHLIQYRGQLMPLVRVNDEVRIKEDGTQPLLVFSDGGRSMGLIVDEIIDIVEDRLDIEVASDRPGLLGSAVIKGEATEIIDVGHFLPLAFADWFRRKDMWANAAKRTLLFVDQSAFFRNMLSPVLKLAGFEVVAAENGKEALAMIKEGLRFDMIVADVEVPASEGIALAEAVRGSKRLAEIPMIALSSTPSPQTIERVRQAGFNDYVAKFDRPGLIAALKEQAADMTRAA
jgi:two-component system chemotaxis sensor kinase CheA